MQWQRVTYPKVPPRYFFLLQRIYFPLCVKEILCSDPFSKLECSYPHFHIRSSWISLKSSVKTRANPNTFWALTCILHPHTPRNPRRIYLCFSKWHIITFYLKLQFGFVFLLCFWLCLISHWRVWLLELEGREIPHFCVLVFIFMSPQHIAI